MAAILATAPETVPMLSQNIIILMALGSPSAAASAASYAVAGVSHPISNFIV